MIWNQQVHGRLYAMIYTELYFLHVCACVCHMYVCVCMQHEHMYVFCVFTAVYDVTGYYVGKGYRPQGGQPGVPPQQAADPLWPYFSHVAGQVCVLNIYHV